MKEMIIESSRVEERGGEKRKKMEEKVREKRGSGEAR